MLGSTTEHVEVLGMVAELGGVICGKLWRAGAFTVWFFRYGGFSTTQAALPPPPQAAPKRCGKEKRLLWRIGGIPGVGYVLI